ncbi:hypothetical protein AB9K17_23660, partial [Salmonella enterica subsp. enterica serovar Kentucky]|uniref:hypothetical protein n=1 Tax=Salmonella enterica TaxID=28901 RepID=UPI003F4B5F50
MGITSALFVENTLPQKYRNGTEERYFGGGGVYIMFRHILQQKYSPTTVLRFQNCTFENNTANTSIHDHLYTNVQGEAREG